MTIVVGGWAMALPACAVSVDGLDEDVTVNPEPSHGGGADGTAPVVGGSGGSQSGSAGQGGTSTSAGKGGAPPAPDAGAFDTRPPAMDTKVGADVMKPADSAPACVDPDRDGHCLGKDNCPNAYNPAQENADGDPRGDACQGKLELFLDAEADRHACGGSTTWTDPVSGIVGKLLGGFASMDCANQTGWVGSPHALNFGDEDDGVKVDIEQNQALNGETFTAEVWARVTDGEGTYRSPLTSRAQAFNPERRMGYNLYAGDNDRWQAWMGGATGGIARWIIVDGGSVAMNRWTHLAMTFDGSLLRFYVDGKLEGQQPVLGFMPNRSRPTRIGGGASEGDGNYFFAGQVAKVLIFSEAQPAALIQARFENDRKRFGR